ncbi:MAG: ThuA domain-containing protein [Verrucomicrobiia bacterium]|jgi:type 1 glutamine amidotransferase
MKNTVLILVLAAAFLIPGGDALAAAKKPAKKAQKKKQPARKKKSWEDWKAEWGKLSADKKAAIAKAAPRKATVKPKQARRVLVFYRCGGFVHSSIGSGNHSLATIAKKTKAFTADFSDVYADFNRDNLRNYDAIIFNNTTHLVLENDSQRDAIIEFMKQGKGVAGIHAAGDNFYKWKLGAAMIGGQFNGHPWNGGGNWAFKLDDPMHVLNKAFMGKGFWHTDEIYQYKPETFEGEEKLRILVSLDMSKEAVSKIMDNPRFDKYKQQYGAGPRQVPVSWLREFEGGRVFFTNLGHRDDTYTKPNVMRHILDGIQYALGDLSADATPTAKSTKVKPALAPKESK